MSHLLRRPGAVPALFSPDIESGPPARRHRAKNAWRDGSASLILPTLALTAELPLIHDAAEVLRLVLPH